MSIPSEFPPPRFLRRYAEIIAHALDDGEIAKNLIAEKRFPDMHENAEVLQNAISLSKEEAYIIAAMALRDSCGWRMVGGNNDDIVIKDQYQRRLYYILPMSFAPKQWEQVLEMARRKRAENALSAR